MHNTKTFYITYEPTLSNLCYLAVKIDDKTTSKDTIHLMSAVTGEIYGVRDNDGLWSFCGYADAPKSNGLIQHLYNKPTKGE